MNVLFAHGGAHWVPLEAFKDGIEAFQNAPPYSFKTADGYPDPPPEPDLLILNDLVQPNTGIWGTLDNQ